MDLYIKDRFGDYYAASSDIIINEAKRRVRFKLRKGTSLTSPCASRSFLQLTLAESEHEVFLIIFLDNQHRVIKAEEMFRGTIDGASVYPREVVKAAIQNNAAAVVLAHNHPSGLSEPSDADKHITQRLKQALGLIDVRILDHFVVGAEGAYSFAEHGLI
jgi:DNA repair protein RadC